MWGVIPAAGAGTRIQPLAFSKELLPVGSWRDGEVERPRAVSEYLLERMVLAGADRVCFVISPSKSDILKYYGAGTSDVEIVYAIQQQPAGLCDAVFRTLPLIPPEDELLVGLPDTIWFPADGLRSLPANTLSFLLFPVDRPQLFDAVHTMTDGTVERILVKQPDTGTRWIWGAIRMTGVILRQLHELWLARGRTDEFLGTLVNAYIQAGGRALGVYAGEAYVDVGTLHGYREALTLLDARGAAPVRTVPLQGAA